MASGPSRVTVSAVATAPAQIVTVTGVLDGSTYATVRDQVIKAALDEPAAVIVDVNALDAPAPSAWSVFTSAQWHVSTWPDVPIMLVCANDAVRATITRNGITRYVPVYPTIEAALATVAAGGRHSRRRARAELPALASSPRQARDLVAEWLTAWSRPELIAVAKVVTDILVENALQHTDSAPVLVAECDAGAVTVTVADGCLRPALRRENTGSGGESVSGLAVLAALCRVWGSAPTPAGKTVWAVIGPENRL